MGSARRRGWIGRVARRLRAWWARARTPEVATRRLGREGESLAAEYLASVGYRVVSRNVRVPMGEADLVCEDEQGAMVIVEVKSRTRGTSARSDAIPPEAAITARKRAKLRQIAAHLARANRWPSVRVDSVGVEFGAGRAPVVRHVRGVA